MANAAHWPVERGLRRFAALFGLGLFGLLAAGATSAIRGGLPTLSASVSYVEVVLAAVVQPVVLLCIAVVVGLIGAPRVGFRSRVREYVSGDQSAWRGFRREIGPAVQFGVYAGLVLVGAGALFGPRRGITGVHASIASVLATVPERFLYAGITEELFLRWGVMTLVAIVLWWALDGRRGTVSPRIAWTAIVVSAVLFGFGHLPAATVYYGELGPWMAGYVVVANSVGGLAYGWLFWRHSLEAAMISHAVTNVVFVTASLVFVVAPSVGSVTWIPV